MKFVYIWNQATKDILKTCLTDFHKLLQQNKAAQIKKAANTHINNNNNDGIQNNLALKYVAVSTMSDIVLFSNMAIDRVL